MHWVHDKCENCNNYNVEQQQQLHCALSTTVYPANAVINSVVKHT